MGHNTSVSSSAKKSKYERHDHVQPIRRFPRERISREQADYIWKDVPKLDLSKVKNGRWLIDFFLAEASIQLVYGTFGTRKTTAMLLAAWAVSQGRDFLGRKTRQRIVLYLDYENPATVLKSYCQDLGIDPSGAAFTIWDRSAGPPPLPGDPRLKDFIRRCKKKTGRYPWIIFDSWTSLLKLGESGNEIGDATPIFRDLRHLCDMGATCTVIDHTGKRKRKDPIGTSAKMTQMDTSHAFLVEKRKTNPLDLESCDTVVRVESFLKRYAPSGIGTFSFQVRAAVGEKGIWHTTSVELAKNISIEEMKHLIRGNPNLGQEELANLAAEKKITSRDSARKLLQEGTGRSWKSIPKGTHGQVFRVLE